MDKCPKCSTSWIGKEIPEHQREFHSPPYYWKREIGISGMYLGIYDGVVATMCPDCKEVMPVDNSELSLDLFKQYLKYHDIKVNDEI